MSGEINHTDIVVQAKADLQAAGIDLLGPCGAWAITNLTAWRLKSEDAGLLEKTAGNNCLGYATDIVCYPNGQIVDVLGNGGGDPEHPELPANVPRWDLKAETVDPTRWKPAVDPFPNPGPGPSPLPPPADLAQRVTALEAQMAALSHVALRSIVNDKIVTMWDEIYGQHPLIANRNGVGIGETFELIPRGKA